METLGQLRVLVIDDDVELCELLRDYLAQEGFEVDAVHEGPAGADKARTGDYALVVLDVMLPGASGFDVLRTIRASSRVPVLMLTARGDDVDRIVGLEMGADDYLPKPFNPRELVARMRAVQRRSTGAAEPGAAVEAITVGDVQLIPEARIVRRAGEPVPVTGTELSLLEILLRAAGEVVSRDALSEQVLGRPLSPLDRSIDVHVSNLRKKLGKLRDGRERIKSVRGVGYVYLVDGSSP